LHRTEVTTETATVTVQTVNLVGVSVVSNVSTPLTTSPVSTTLVISTMGVSLNSSSTIQNGEVLNTTSPTGVVGSSGGGSSLGYVSPTSWGTYGSPSGEERGKSGYSSQPLTYDQPSAGNDGDGENGYGSSTSNGGEEGDGGAGSSSYGDSGEYEGDVETGHWEFGSAPDSEDSGSESEEQSGGSSFLDWLLEILR
jgi:hypothetical protein